MTFKLSKRLILVVLFALHAGLVVKPILDYSPTFDETVHITSGYAYWKTGDYRYNGYHHPPFVPMWATIPLLFLNPVLPTLDPRWIRQRWDGADQYQFANIFIYHNRMSADQIVSAARFMQIPLSILLGFIILWIVTRLYGFNAGILAVFIWALNPLFLTQASLVTTDYAFSIFFFLFFALKILPLGWPRYLLRGLAFGLCFSSKYFALTLIIVSGFEFLLDVISASPMKKKKAIVKEWLKESIIILIGAFMTIQIVLQGQGFDVWKQGLMNMVTRSQSGRASYLFGQRYTQGTPIYFPLAILVKTPIPYLLILLSLPYLIWKKKIIIPRYLWLPPIVFLLVASFSKVQIGIRYVLCIYPFWVVAMGGALNLFHGRWRVLKFILLVWLLASTLWIQPHFIAYFNEFVGGPSQGYRYLTDSNLDWGQSLKELPRHLTQDDLKNGIYLNYFGTADPHSYGLKHWAMGSDRFLAGQSDDREAPLQPTKFVISVTHLQGTYYQSPEFFAWLHQFKPWKVVGYSLFIYDFSSRPDILAQLRDLYLGQYGNGK